MNKKGSNSEGWRNKEIKQSQTPFCDKETNKKDREGWRNKEMKLNQKCDYTPFCDFACDIGHRPTKTETGKEGGKKFVLNIF